MQVAGKPGDPRTLTKMDIVLAVAEKYEMQVAPARRVVQETLDQILLALQKGRKVELRNFGVFKVIERKGRVARNPRSRQEVFIPACKVVKFIPGKILQEEITDVSINAQGGIKPIQRNKPGLPPTT